MLVRKMTEKTPPPAKESHLGALELRSTPHWWAGLLPPLHKKPLFFSSSSPPTFAPHSHRLPPTHPPFPSAGNVGYPVRHRKELSAAAAFLCFLALFCQGVKLQDCTRLSTWRRGGPCRSSPKPSAAHAL